MSPRRRSVLAAIPVLIALALAPSASATCNVISAYVPAAKAWYGAADAPPKLHFDVADDEGTTRNFANDTTAYFFATTGDGPFGWSATPPWSTYAVGANSVRVALFCRAGTQAAYLAVSYDPFAPTIAWSAPAADQWVRGSVPLQVAGEDGLSGIDHFVYSLPGGAVSTAAGSATLDTIGLPDGPRALVATAFDRAGNQSSVATRAIRIDNTPPVAALDAPAAAAIVSSSLTLQASVTDAGSGIAQVRFEQRPAIGGTWQALGADSDAPYRIVMPPTGADGDYDVRAIADDALGNEAATTASAMTIDRTAPTVVLDDIAAAASGTIALAATASDAGSGISQVEFQEAPAGSTAWSTIATVVSTPLVARWATTGVPDGAYAVRALVRDRAGNTLASAVHATTVRNGVDAPVARSVPAPAAAVAPRRAAVALFAVALPRRVESGGAVVIRGVARGVANGAVVVTLTSTGSPRVVQRVRATTTRNGSFRVSLRPRFSGHVRVMFAGDAGHRAASADGGVVGVHPRLIAAVTATRAADGSLGNPHVHGHMAPNGAAVRLVWQARPAHGGAWLLFCRSSDQIAVGRNGVIDGVCHVRGLHADNRYRLVLAGGSGASYLPAVTPALVARPTS